MAAGDLSSDRLQQVTHRSIAVALLLALVAIVASNVLLHRRIDESAKFEWAAITRSDGDRFTSSVKIRQRYGMFFALRPHVNGSTVVEVPSTWDDTEAGRYFERSLRHVMIGVSRVGEIERTDAPPDGQLESWFGPDLGTLRDEGYVVSEGRSQANGRQPWYQWRIVLESSDPSAVRIYHDAEFRYLVLDSRLIGRDR